MNAALANTFDCTPRAGRAVMDDVEPLPEFDANALMAKVTLSRDREAFRALFVYFAPRVKTYLLRQGATPTQAEELAQETLLIVWREADRFQPERAPVAGWLFTIARNLRIDALRRERSAVAYSLAVIEPPSPITPEAASTSSEREERLRRAVKDLPEDQVDLIRRSFFLDMPHAQIAHELSLPLGTVKSRIRLAVKRLRTLLGDLA